MDYVRMISNRIAETIQRVSAIPAENDRPRLDQTIQELQQRRDQMKEVCDESNEALKALRHIARLSATECKTVEAIHLAPASDNIPSSQL